jgi:putative spermidine/putrescine transport system ATP-binding protein
LPIRSSHRDQYLVLRPEKLRLAQSGTGDGEANVFEGTVKQVVYQGESMLLYVTLAGGEEIAARLSSSRAYAEAAPGSTVRLALSAADTLVVPDEDRP